MKRRAFTLTELMVSITIVAILSSVALYAMASVQTLAKEQRTKTQIKRIHELIAPVWEEYEDRSVRITSTLTGRDRSRARLYALREIMKLEMPDRVTDVWNSIENGLTREVEVGGTQQYSPMNPPSLWRYYNSKAKPGWSITHQGAECLYMILSRIEVGDMTALESFTERDIGDTDNDGMPEILDAWGNPLRFVRWAPGFAGPSTFQTRLATDGYDAFDLGRLDFRNTDDKNDPTATDFNDTFFMFPLIFSSGADGDDNIWTEVAGTGLATNFIIYSETHSDSRYNANWTGAGIPNDPYATIRQGGDDFQLGQVENTMSDAHVDNVYNHFIETSTN